MRRALVLAVALFTLAPKTAEALSAPAGIVEDLKAKLTAFKRDLQRTSDPAAAAIIEKVELRILPGLDVMRVQARRDHGARVVDLSVGYAVLIGNVIDVSYLLGPSHGIDYVTYAARNRSTPAALKPWPEWAGLTPPVRERLVAADPKAALDRSKAWLGALAFTLAHELAHHVLGHVDGQASIRTEIAADAWAAAALVRMNVGPIVGYPVFELFAAIDCNALKEQGERSHPADITRLDALLQATRAGMSKLAIDGDASAFAAQLDQIQAQLKGLIGSRISCVTPTAIDPGAARLAPPMGEFCVPSTDSSGLSCSPSLKACEADRRELIAQGEEAAPPCAPVSSMYCGSRRWRDQRVTAYCYAFKQDCIDRRGRYEAQGKTSEVFDCRYFSSER